MSGITIEGNVTINYGDIFGNTRTAVTTQAFGNAITSNAQFQFGNASYYSNNQPSYLSINNSGGNLNFGTSDFTIEFWYYRVAIPSGVLYPTVISNFTSGYVSGTFTIQESREDAVNKVTFDAPTISGPGTWLTSTSNISANTWYAIAVTRQGNTFRLFLDGVLQVTKTSTASLDLDQNRNLFISQPQSVTFINAYVDELRVSSNCRYTGNYTVSTTPLSNDSSTKLLLHCDGTNGGNIFLDDNTGNIPTAGITIGY